MISRKLIFWLSFSASGAIAYLIAFLDGFWPMGRVIAGWYAIFVIVAVACAVIIALSVKCGAIRYRPELDMFDFF